MPGKTVFSPPASSKGPFYESLSGRQCCKRFNEHFVKGPPCHMHPGKDIHVIFEDAEFKICQLGYSAVTPTVGPVGAGSALITASTVETMMSTSNVCRWRGLWRPNEEYALNDRISIRCKVYVCSRAHTSNGLWSVDKFEYWVCVDTLERVGFTEDAYSEKDIFIDHSESCVFFCKEGYKKNLAIQESLLYLKWDKVSSMTGAVDRFRGQWSPV